MDQDGDVLDILVARRRDARAAKRFFRKLLKGQGGIAMATGHRQARKLCGRPPGTRPIGYPSHRTVRKQPGRSVPPAHQGARTPNAAFHAGAAFPAVHAAT